MNSKRDERGKALYEKFIEELKEGGFQLQWFYEVPEWAGLDEDRKDFWRDAAGCEIEEQAK